MQESTTIRRMSARTAAALLLAVVGMLALGGAWTSAFASNGNGANQSGPYDSTSVPCDNQGNGNAPCNGTVGNADDKNPPGQQPGGNDHNNGYECDGNNGVGNNGGNPAHSGCVTTTTGVGSSGCTNPNGCDEGCTSSCDSGCVSSCGSSVTPNTPQADVLGVTEDAPPGASPASPASPAAAVAGTQLAFTGATSSVLGFLAVALLAFGMAFILVARKPTESMSM
jgi:hypothetical protein